VWEQSNGNGIGLYLGVFPERESQIYLTMKHAFIMNFASKNNSKRQPKKSYIKLQTFNFKSNQGSHLSVFWKACPCPVRTESNTAKCPQNVQKSCCPYQMSVYSVFVYLIFVKSIKKNYEIYDSYFKNI
jgi:hypothetical protein